MKAVVTKGKKVGTYMGRVAVRASGSFNIQSAEGLAQGISHRYCILIQRSDGYGYSLRTEIAINYGEARTLWRYPNFGSHVIFLAHILRRTLTEQMREESW